MPEEDPLQIGIAVEQESLFGLEGGRELIEKEPQRFRQSLIHLHGRIDAREEIDLGHKPPVEVAEISEACATGKCSSQKPQPGDHAHPVQFAATRRAQHQDEGDGSGKRDGQIKTPANASRVADEHEGKPHRYRGRTDIDEISQGEQIANQRQMPRAFSEEPLQLRHKERRDQISNQKRNGTPQFIRRPALQYSEQCQQNEYGSRVNNLPLEMVTVRLMRAHARERVSYPFSLTRCEMFVAGRFPGCNGGLLELADSSMSTSQHPR